MIWTPTPDRRATERATSAAGTPVATLVAHPTAGTLPPGGSAEPGGPGAGGPGPGAPGTGSWPAVGTPSSGAGGSGSAPGAESTPFAAGGGGAGGTGSPGDPGASAPGAGPPPAGAGPGGGAVGAGTSSGESGLVSATGFPFRRAAPWLPPVTDGVIAELWARYGSPTEGASWSSRLTGEALGARRPGVFGRIWFYVAVFALLCGSVTWLLVEVRTVANEQQTKTERTGPPPKTAD